MDISKSSRHAKITGDFGEGLTLYWLSKYGFECASVDHTGIDLIARHPKEPKLFGISVKSRSRSPGKEASSLLIERAQFERAKEACDTFLCEPYFSLVIDGAGKIFIYVMPIEVLAVQLGENKTVNWKMGDSAIRSYHNDPRIMSIEMSYNQHSWGSLSF